MCAAVPSHTHAFGPPAPPAASTACVDHGKRPRQRRLSALSYRTAPSSPSSSVVAVAVMAVVQRVVEWPATARSPCMTACRSGKHASMHAWRSSRLSVRIRRQRGVPSSPRCLEGKPGAGGEGEEEEGKYDEANTTHCWFAPLPAVPPRLALRLTMGSWRKLRMVVLWFAQLCPRPPTGGSQAAAQR